MTESYALNNDAAMCIRAGEYDNAISSLQRAVKKVRLAISGDLTPGLYLEDVETGADDDLPFCSFISTDSSCFLKSVRNDSQHTIFGSPISLNQALPVTNTLCCEKLSYVIVYNLALAHHLKAMTSQLSRRMTFITFERALRLYENAHCVLMGSPEIDVSILHTLALVCNLGHLHCVLGNKERSDLCYQNLLSTMIYLVDCGEVEDTIEGTIPLDGFFSNVMPLICNQASAPAA
jgi:hypothetical protein